MIAKEFTICAGRGFALKYLPSFDKALLDAGVGNYNLVRLSSILPAHCKFVHASEITKYIQEGSLLPTAYSTISSNKAGEEIVSTIGVGLSENEDDVGVIMEFSATGMTLSSAFEILRSMIDEAFEVRGWTLKQVLSDGISAIVPLDGTTTTTFACIAQW